METIGYLAITLVILFLGGQSGEVLAQPASVKDCSYVLKSKDYYSYAEKNNLQADYLRSIDSETWEEMKHDNSFSAFGIFSGGLFSLNDDYNQFDNKRAKYLESIHYNRTESEAKNILQITTSPRTYSAYAECLQHISQSGLIAYVDKEDASTLELNVLYKNPAGVASMSIDGFVSGGSVAGAPAGHLWDDQHKVWGVNQARVLTISRSPGSSETTIIIAPADGSQPFSKHYYRADGTLSLEYVGTTSVLLVSNMRVLVKGTPNNDKNKGTCPNMVGHADGKWCQSKTPLTASTTPPNFFKNARVSCEGFGCGWINIPPASIDPTGTTASGSIINWGPPAQAVLLVDQYENLSKDQCGGDGPIPVIYGQTVLFTSSKQCLPIATIQSNSLIDQSSAVVKFGQTDGKIVTQSQLDTGDSIVASYKLTP
ncbi:hypothetical protein [Paraburkholderia oxyphila]|uniref:hypothetical protein n=1 Tax=Paraburkholderia oxyphila TaxID=614212 RepID=UPI000B17DE59|nr:hypothetical protein [Paraburkholderia oxyphila]